ncbi:hypothetical protein FBEOM_9435 [Fusarium beomiforme]|uniref:Uncharacterized protein n=1 Tax=Fusarium beomiforme TaxID=44412 RepID=A0A9P5AD67_9HYPO|nr:hypothetical protein FBEOM_9435 [Fusarium beomiforme]
MNSSMSPTLFLLCAILYINAAPALARFVNYPLPTTTDVTNQALTAPTPVITKRREFRFEARSAEDVPTYTVTYAPDSVCGYLSGSVQIPITCENKNTCLWELDYFKYIACELKGETTGIARTKCLAKDEALDPNLCEDDCVSNTYNLLCTNDTAPYCRTYAYPRGVRDYRCAPTPATRVSSVDFTFEGQKYPKFVILTLADVDTQIQITTTSSTKGETESAPATSTAAEASGDKGGLAKEDIGAIVAVLGVFVIVGIGVGIWYYRKRTQKKNKGPATLMEAIPPGDKVNRRKDRRLRPLMVAKEDLLFCFERRNEDLERGNMREFAAALKHSNNKTKHEREAAVDPFSKNKTTPSRLAACVILKEAGVPFLIWHKDVVRNDRGAIPILESLFLVLPDTQAAEKILLGAGYTPGGQHADLRRRNAWVQNMNDYYIPPKPKITLNPSEQKNWGNMHLLEYSAVALLSAERECVQLPDQPLDFGAWYPKLSEYVTALITKYVGLTEPSQEDPRSFVNLCLENAYGHKQVENPEFETTLPAKYRLAHRFLIEEYKFGNTSRQCLFKLKTRQTIVEKFHEAEASEAAEVNQ